MVLSRADKMIEGVVTVMGRRPRTSAIPETALETAAQTVGTTDRLGSSRKTTRKKVAASSEGRTKAARTRATTEPRKRSA